MKYTKRKIAQRVINVDLRLLTDKDLQKKTWCNKKELNQASFSEIIEDFLYDLNLIIKDFKKYHINEKHITLLKAFYNTLNSYYESCPFDDQKIIEDPKWDEIREFAKEVLSALEETKQ